MDVDSFNDLKKRIEAYQKAGTFKDKREMMHIGVSATGVSDAEIEKAKAENDQRNKLQDAIDKAKKDGTVNKKIIDDMTRERDKLTTTQQLNAMLAQHGKGGTIVEKIFASKNEYDASRNDKNNQLKDLVDIQKDSYNVLLQQYQLDMEKQKEDVVTRNIRLEANGFAAAITTPVMRTGANSYMGGGIFDKNQNISEQTPINVIVNGNVYGDGLEQIKKGVAEAYAGKVDLGKRAYSNGG